MNCLLGTSDYSVKRATKEEFTGVITSVILTNSFSCCRQLEAMAATNRSHVYSTPVIVMRGVNHAQFASGAMPKEVVTHDLTPEVTSQAAYTLIAKHTSAFLVATLRAPQAALAQARADLDAAYSDTLNIIKVKWRPKKDDDVQFKYSSNKNGSHQRRLRTYI